MKYDNIFNLRNKNAYVLGGVGLIGKEIVEALATFKAKVIILDINKNKGIKFEKLLLKKKLKVKYEYFDITDIKFNEKLLKNIFKKYGSPHIMINSTYPKLDTWSKSNFKDTNYQIMSSNINNNLLSSSWIAKIFADYMLIKKISGSIITMGSIYGMVAQNPNFYKNTNMKENMFYPIIKGGLISYTKQMASYYGKFNIRINIISPGGIKGHIAGKSKTQNPNFIKNYINNVPLKRMCTPKDIANASIFLSSDSSNYITGANLIIDGGITSIL